MLNTATPILQIKVSGIVLSDVKTMTVSIKSQTTTITKGNADIEVDNDVISVFLTQSEAQSLNDGSFNVSISAVNFDNEDVTESIKVIWTKKGSMSKSPESNLEELVLQINGGVRLGKDAEGNAGIIETNPETGAVTVLPFRVRK